MAGTEHLGVDAVRRDARRREAGRQIAHEARWSANIKIAVAGQIELLKQSHVQAPGSIEIDIGPVLRIGRAVADDGCEGGPIACSSPRASSAKGCSRPLRVPCSHQISRVDAFRRQRMKHREHRRHADPGTEQDDRRLARPQRKTAACGAGLHDVANFELVVDVAARCAMGFPLDADAIKGGARLARQRIAAHQRGRGRLSEPQHDELPGQSRGDGLPVGGFEHAARSRCHSRAPCAKREAGGIQSTPGLAGRLVESCVSRSHSPLRCWISSASKERCQPVLRAGIRSARSS